MSLALPDGYAVKCLTGRELAMLKSRSDPLTPRKMIGKQNTGRRTSLRNGQRSQQSGHRMTHPEQSRVRLVLPRRVIANILCKRFHGDLHPTEHELRALTLYVTLTVSTSECSGVEHIARMGYNSFCGTGPFPYPAKNPVICVNSGWMQGSIDLPKDDKL